MPVPPAFSGTSNSSSFVFPSGPVKMRVILMGVRAWPNTGTPVIQFAPITTASVGIQPSNRMPESSFFIVAHTLHPTHVAIKEMPPAISQRFSLFRPRET